MRPATPAGCHHYVVDFVSVYEDIPEEDSPSSR